ncbi:MAG: heavy-metal-associated domain-containing protein [Cypionkella sp.]
MLDLTIPDMTCGGCARGVTAAIKAIDPGAELVIDIDTHKVQVKTSATAEAVKAAVVEAGFTPS